ncbi:hypothetical protein KXJ81_35065, partial [Ensifer adhaerens]|uniref:hypothetical protein n=1 Tax=Ensifer adhaerens TaxID=106592 RepID=UPI001C4E2051
GDIWPTSDEIAKLMKFAMNADTFRTNYEQVKKSSKLWANVKGTKGQVYDWTKSTYIAEPTFFESFGMTPAVASESVKG